MTAYYNEFEPYAADWLEALIAAGHLPAGDVDRRDIREVKADELEGYDQCHFFAGIGGWAQALALAGWPPGEPVWTASCPCQPLSSAGQRKGHADERHLWPAFYQLVAERRPAVVLGEQVSGKDGREWLAGVRADLEAAGYAVGAADLCAAGAGENAQGRVHYEDHSFAWKDIVVGAPHIRQRLFWVADRLGAGLAGRPQQPARQERQALERSGPTGGLADAQRGRAGTGAESPAACEDTAGAGRWSRSEPRDHGPAGGLGDADRGGRAARIEGPEIARPRHPADPDGRAGGLGAAERQRAQGHERRARQGEEPEPESPSTGGFWSAFDLVPCSDGKARRVEPGTFPLAHGIPNRVGQLRAYGNAIVPQVAAAFVSAYLEAR